MSILVTGAAGFIGAHVCQALAARGESVVGLDNFNAYYDPQIKRARIQALCPGVRVVTLDLADAGRINALFDELKPTRVVHMAAQAGVRYSISNPNVYADSNLVGFTHILEACRRGGIGHLVYASSSSVYGGNARHHFPKTSASISRCRSTRPPKPPTS